MTRDYKTLDAIVVVGGLVLVCGFGWALVFKEIHEAQLPVLSSLGTGVLALVGLYTNMRWGNKKAPEETSGTTITTPEKVTVDQAKGVESDQS